ncbi:MAG: Rpn family recombination-promoting nuclease/putative transposase [Lachnospiraceae bacterium]|nr:Rpn family recombination-promoting nuclease/putative transposase [Lachnospiraceae bacterium]
MSKYFMQPVKKFEELTIRDSFMFGTVMEDPSLCREFLEVLLQRPVGSLSGITREKDVKLTEDGKAIRLDIYAKDLSDGSLIDAEMQNLNKQSLEALNLPKRSRYYQSLIDLQALSVTDSYRQLSDSNIIFICTFDPFELGSMCYTFTERCNELPNLELGSGTRKYFFNTTAIPSDMPRDMHRLYNYINNGTVSDELTRRIDDSVKVVRLSSEKRALYMKTLTWLDDEKYYAREEGLAEGREQGLSEGREQGLSEGRMDTLIELYLEGSITKELALSKMGISAEELDRYAADMKARTT